MKQTGIKKSNETILCGQLIDSKGMEGKYTLRNAAEVDSETWPWRRQTQGTMISAYIKLATVLSAPWKAIDGSQKLHRGLFGLLDHHSTTCAHPRVTTMPGINVIPSGDILLRSRFYHVLTATYFSQLDEILSDLGFLFLSGVPVRQFRSGWEF